MHYYMPLWKVIAFYLILINKVKYRIKYIMKVEDGFLLIRYDTIFCIYHIHNNI
jgi:hypothetical protein